MFFRIGAKTYSVRRKWDLACDNVRADGVCDTSRRIIWLDGELSREAMISTLRHELHHAWEAECGPAADEEARANLSATVAEAFDEAFEQQGGLPKLLLLEIEGLAGRRRDPNEMATRAGDERRSCPCGTELAPGGIYTGDPQEDRTAGGFICERGFQCPICSRTITWLESCTKDGRRMGRYFCVQILTGEKEAAWLQEHPVHEYFNVA